MAISNMTTPMTAPAQFDLFSELIANDSPVQKITAKRSAIILPATPSADVIAIAQNLPTSISASAYLGTSSWSFAGWNGLVYDGHYPETRLARDGLHAYSQHPLLRTVGIDRTFYAPIAEKDYARYAAQVPAHFPFMVKAPMAVTSAYVRNESGRFSDSPYFMDADYAIDEFIAPCAAGLDAKIGPMVFQFPPQGRAVTGTTQTRDAWINRLYRFLKLLPPGFLYAVEIRDPELFTERFLKCLNATQVRLCVASHAWMPSPAAQIAAMKRVLDPGPFIARWSLHAGFKYEDAKEKYFPFNKLVDEDQDSRQSLALASLDAWQTGHAAFVVVNNKAEGSAPLSIEKLAACIADGYHRPTQAVPPTS